MRDWLAKQRTRILGLNVGRASESFPRALGATEDRTAAALREVPLLHLGHGGTTSRAGTLKSGAPAPDVWCLRDALEGTQVFGATGSGKTSGSGATIARAFLDPARGNMGGLVLAAKPEEIHNWRRYLVDVGRNPDLDLIELKPGGRHRFNVLQYELAESQRVSGGETLTHNLVSLFLAALSTGDGAASTIDPYWNDALRELLCHTIDLVLLAGHEIELQELLAIVRSAPQDSDEVKSQAWQTESRCFELLATANARRHILSYPRLEDLRQTVAYWLRDFPTLNGRTRSIIVSSLTSKASGLLRSPLRELLCTDTTPECIPQVTHRGKVLLLNIPVKLFGEIGRFAQCLYKTTWQRATERRELEGDWRPVFLWADEAQYFLTSEDMLFQQTARSKFAATVYLSQNIPNYHAALGPTGQAATESLLGNLQTKVFHANGDPTTNDWAQRLIGHDWKSVHSAGQSGETMTFSRTPTMSPIVLESSFTTLAKGGEHNSLRTSAILFQGGRLWKSNSGKNWILHTFLQ